jgi:CRISPR-associated protein Cas2
MPLPQLWIVAYDSPSNRRRRKIAELLEGYGQRLQWSVFECQLLRGEQQSLVRHLQRLVNPEQDRVRLWPLSESGQTRVIQIGLPPPEPPARDAVV